ESRYDVFDSSFAECDVVLVEGDTNTAAPKLEVWRAINETEPLIETVPGIVAVVTDDTLPNAPSLLPRSDIRAVADFIYEVAASS
ncbi:MAG: molybdopterin-guanine dinucleotide biosynthesis protein B, partial [Planctomycetaceae bacterium]